MTQLPEKNTFLLNGDGRYSFQAGAIQRNTNQTKKMSKKALRRITEQLRHHAGWSAYENAVEAAEDCGWTSEDDEPEDKEFFALQYLNDNTDVIEVDGCIIVRTDF